ncbi:MAG: disulfide bond formation protein B [Chlamydiales bacterium]|jgi:disulfide bond formation protein DsbB|nr:disulfide bond formation protein B [Chlamydiales bacterium]
MYKLKLALLERSLNAIWAFVICGVLLGGYSVQFLKHELPCPLCLLQRLSMIGVAMGPLLNLRFDIYPTHYAVSILSALFGGFVSLRQISLHVCPGFSSFGEPVLGLELYTWALIVFASSIFVSAIMLFLHITPPQRIQKMQMNTFENMAFWLVLFMTTANVVTTLQECGLSACTG